MFPFCKDNLKAKLADLGKQLSDPLIPTLGLRIYGWTLRKVHVRPHPIPLLPTEGQEQDLGLEHLPLIEVVGIGAPLLPTHDKLEQSLTTFLQAAVPTNNLSNKTRHSSSLWNNNFLKKAPGTLSFIMWPEYQGLLPEGDTNDSPAGRRYKLV